MLISILKAGNASTISVVDGIRAMLPRVAQTLPPALKIVPVADQSVFVKAAIAGTIREAVIAALPDRDDDPDLPRQLAQHHHHRGFHSAVDPVLDHRAWRAGPDDQHHDAGRPGAGGRHPGRRRHRHDREHGAPPGRRQRPARRHPAWRVADRGAGAGIHVVHLHRVRADVPAGRRAGLPVHAAGGSRGVRHARLLRAVAHPGADDGDVSAEGQAASFGALAQSAGAGAAGLRTRLRAVPRRLSRCAGHRGAPPDRVHPVIPGGLRRDRRPGAVARPGLLPRHRQRAVHPAHARQDRHPHRGYRAARRSGRGRHPPDHPAA